jgi:tetratricopeptide (TPR) repeat protein
MNNNTSLLSKTKFLVALFIFFTFVINGQEKYFSRDEVSFDTKMEENIVIRILEGEDLFFDGFLAVSSNDSMYFDGWKNSFYSEIDILKKRKIPKKKEKDIRNIYNHLHDKFLKKYEQLAFFDQIFESGTYNCVSAVALFALTFNELEIPFVIKETPTHVYIVAEPDSEQLLIETTDPISGFKTFSAGFKENFVVQLGMMKLVSESDISSKGIYGVFDEFYFGGDDLTIRELLGAQYYNIGVGYYNDNKFVEATKALSKAQLFDENSLIDELLFFSVVRNLASSNYNDWGDIQLIPVLNKFEGQDMRSSNIVGEFARMLQIVLNNNNEVEKADKAYHYFISNVDDVEMVKDASFLYYYERGRIAYNRASYTDSFKYMTKAYSAKPGNADTETLLIESFRLGFRNLPIQTSLLAMDSLISQNPSLSVNNRINAMFLNLHLVKMIEDFNNKDSESGERMRYIFEQKVEENPSLQYDRLTMGEAYSSAAVYYFKKGYITTSRNILKKGLEYDPYNYELKSRIRMINR